MHICCEERLESILSLGCQQDCNASILLLTVDAVQTLQIKAEHCHAVNQRHQERKPGVQAHKDM